MAIPTGAHDVTDGAGLVQVAEAVGTGNEVAVDVEADSMHHFRARLCFVQVGTDREIFLVDTLADGVRLDPLQAAFTATGITKFFHAAQGDLTYLAEANVRVRGLFDTHRAATLLGWPKVGLADLVLEHCGATLKKEHQQADFSQRPLPGELRDYIADDVRYLVDVGRLVREACAKTDILEEVLLDCDRMCEDATARPDPLANFSPKLPRGELKGDRLVLAWQLAQRLNQLRHAWAEVEDVPVGRMLSNMAVVAIGTHLPETQRELARAAGVRGAFVRAHGDEVLSLVRELRAKLASGTLEPMPERTREQDPRKKRREEALLNWRKVKAAERKVTPSVVLSNLLVEDLARLNPRDFDELKALPWFGAKRIDLYGREVLDLLASASR